jgi:hypothetical protein
LVGAMMLCLRKSIPEPMAQSKAVKSQRSSPD